MKILVFIATIFFTTAINAATTARLNVTISGITKLKGNLRVAIFDNPKSCKKRPFKNFVISADAGTVYFSIEELEIGDFAILLFQDLNLNAKLDTNLIGIPREPWGGSFIRKSNYGKPKWKNMVFDHSEKGTELEINLN